MPKPTNFSVFFSTYLSQTVPENHEGECRLDCPFEDCPNPDNHFYANCSDGTWQCKRCDKSGNARTLITMLHEQYLHQTTQAQYRSLSEVRGLKAQTLEDAGFAYDYNNDRWLVPYYTYDYDKDEWSPFLNNLGYFYPSAADEKTRYKIKKGKGLPLYLYNPGLHQYPPEPNALIFEGEWDTLAYYEIDPETPHLILGKPGAGWKDEYQKTLSKCKTIVFFLDNDESGRKQTALAASKTFEYIKDVRSIDWTIVQGAQKDIRDQWMQDGPLTFQKLKDAILPYDTTEIQQQKEYGVYQTSIGNFDEVDNFNSYIDNAKKDLYLTPDTILSIAAVHGITNSIRIPGEPLWAFLIGPPSSGKTTFIDSFGGNNEYFDNLSKITSKSLISGWKDETSREPSYLIKLKNLTLFVKDFTVTLSDSADEQRELFGLLTDIFDGYVKIPYGNNQVKEFYGLYFNLVAGVTDKVHAHSAASIGERFFRIDYLGKDYDTREFARRALSNFGTKSPEKKERLMANTLGFVKYMRQMPLNEEIPSEYHEPIIDLAEFIAIIRTKVESDQKEGIKYRPRPELPSRLAIGLGKLFVSVRSILCIDPDKEEYLDHAGKLAWEVVKKVGIDTCYGFPLDIVRTIYKHPSIKREELAHKADVHATRVYRVLSDLKTTGVINEVKYMSKGGRPPAAFLINPKLEKVLEYDSQKTTELQQPKYPVSSTRAKRRGPRPNR